MHLFWVFLLLVQLELQVTQAGVLVSTTKHPNSKVTQSDSVVSTTKHSSTKVTQFNPLVSTKKHPSSEITQTAFLVTTKKYSSTEALPISCQVPSDCGLGAVCFSGHCTCPVGRTWNANQTGCLRVDCKNDSDFCWTWPNTICGDKSSCICRPEYTYSSSHTTCTLSPGYTVLIVLGSIWLCIIICALLCACCILFGFILSQPAILTSGPEIPLIGKQYMLGQKQKTNTAKSCKRSFKGKQVNSFGKRQVNYKYGFETSKKSVTINRTNSLTDLMQHSDKDKIFFLAM